MVSRGLRGAINWTSIAPRDASLMDSRFKFFQYVAISLVGYLFIDMNMNFLVRHLQHLQFLVSMIVMYLIFVYALAILEIENMRMRMFEKIYKSIK